MNFEHIFTKKQKQEYLYLSVGYFFLRENFEIMLLVVKKMSFSKIVFFDVQKSIIFLKINSYYIF